MSATISSMCERTLTSVIVFSLHTQMPIIRNALLHKNTQSYYSKET